MKHDELLTELFWGLNQKDYTYKDKILRAVVELHTPEQISGNEVFCRHCICYYPCKTIKTIKEGLK